MNLLRNAIVGGAVASLVVFFSVEARADYSESVNGSFSTVNTAPTNVAVASGSNRITGDVGPSSTSSQYRRLLHDHRPGGSEAGSRSSSTPRGSNLGSAGRSRLLRRRLRYVHLELERQRLGDARVGSLRGEPGRKRPASFDGDQRFRRDGLHSSSRCRHLLLPHPGQQRRRRHELPAQPRPHAGGQRPRARKLVPRRSARRRPRSGGRLRVRAATLRRLRRRSPARPELQRGSQHLAPHPRSRRPAWGRRLVAGQRQRLARERHRPPREAGCPDRR